MLSIIVAGGVRAEPAPRDPPPLREYHFEGLLLSHHHYGDAPRHEQFVDVVAQSGMTEQEGCELLLKNVYDTMDLPPRKKLDATSNREEIQEGRERSKAIEVASQSVRILGYRQYEPAAVPLAIMALRTNCSARSSCVRALVQIGGRNMLDFAKAVVENPQHFTYLDRNHLYEGLQIYLFPSTNSTAREEMKPLPRLSSRWTNETAKAEITDFLIGAIATDFDRAMHLDRLVAEADETYRRSYEREGILTRLSPKYAAKVLETLRALPPEQRTHVEVHPLVPASAGKVTGDPPPLREYHFEGLLLSYHRHADPPRHEQFVEVVAQSGMTEQEGCELLLKNVYDTMELLPRKRIDASSNSDDIRQFREGTKAMTIAAESVQILGYCQYEPAANPIARLAMKTPDVRLACAEAIIRIGSANMLDFARLLFSGSVEFAPEQRNRVYEGLYLYVKPQQGRLVPEVDMRLPPTPSSRWTNEAAKADIRQFLIDTRESEARWVRHRDRLLSSADDSYRTSYERQASLERLALSQYEYDRPYALPLLDVLRALPPEQRTHVQVNPIILKAAEKVPSEPPDPVPR